MNEIGYAQKAGTGPCDTKSLIEVHWYTSYNEEEVYCQASQLTFNIIKPKDKSVSALAYAYYHGHLIETFLNHFDNSFGNGFASALPETDDNIGTA